MSDSNADSSLGVPAPTDSGTSGIQKDAQISLSIPDDYPAGGLMATPISQGYQHFVSHSPEQLGSLPTFMLGVHLESVQEKKRLDAKLQEYETKISGLFGEVSKLKEENAVLKTTLNAESRVKLMRSASITGGMAILAFGFKLCEKEETLPVGIGLILIGAAFAAFGWLSRAAKEVK